MSVTIGIVGGGTAGACMINVLAERLPDRSGAEPGEIVVFDDTVLWWRGRAYQDDGDFVWCNVPMSRMSVRHHDPDHGLAWMRVKGMPVIDPVTGQPALVTRPACDYLCTATREAITRLTDRGWSVRLVHRRVTIFANPRGVRLKTNDGGYHDLDRVILAAGAGAYRLSGAPHCLPDPYPLSKSLADLPCGCRVGILGAGLAAVDVAVALQSLGHDCPVRMLCRSGLLPTVRSPHTDYELNHLTLPAIERAASDGPLTFATVRGLLERELRTANSSFDRLPGIMHPRPSLEYLFDQLGAFHTSIDIGPQIIQKTVPAIGQDVVYLLAQDARRWVLDHLHRAVMAQCWPVPPINAHSIVHLLSTGQLTIHPGTTSVQSACQGGFIVETSAGPARVDLLVNTVTPVHRNTPRPARALIDHAIATGQPQGGIHLDRRTSRALPTCGSPQSRLYILGDLSGGAFYSISGMPTLVKRSSDIAQRLVSPHSPRRAAMPRRSGSGEQPWASSKDLFDTLAQPEHLRDPYPFYAWLRAHHPVYANPDGTVYISRHAQARLLKDPDLRDAPEDDAHSYTLRTINQALIKAVPPRHTRLRQAGAAAFDRRLLTGAQPRLRQLAEHLADGLATAIARDGDADLHLTYSLPFTQHAAATIFGIPDEDFELLAALPVRMFGALYPKTSPRAVADADDASRTLFAYLQDAVQHHRFTDGSGFARLTEAVDLMPLDDIIRLCWMLWWGSYTSALAAIDLAVLTLLEHPHVTPLLLQNTKAWVEEALRYRSPHVINSANLTTRHEMSIGTTTLAPHTPIRFLLAAINRDEAAFPHADTFDPHRTGTPHHIAFGEGIHSCIGAQLARMEMATALTTLATRLPGLALAAPPTWRPYTTQRLCSHFPVTTW